MRQKIAVLILLFLSIIAYGQNITIDCGDAPLDESFCYTNFDNNLFQYTSSDGSPLRISINEGGIEVDYDFLVVLDSDGVTQLYFDDGNFGDLTGLSFQSTGDTIFLYVDSDESNSCQDSFLLEIEYTVSCASCISPEVVYRLSSDCSDNRDEFFVTADVSSLGSASSLILSDDQGSVTQTASAAGLYSFGPYSYGTPVIVTTANPEDASCTLVSDSLTQTFCTDVVVDCSEGGTLFNYCYSNNDDNLIQYTSSNGSPLELTIDSGFVEGAPFDILIVLDSDGVTELYNGEGLEGELSGLTFQSTGDTIYFSVRSDDLFSCADGEYDPIDFTIRCLTCVDPTANFLVVDDCDNGDQFLVDVDITSLGDADSVLISDNQGSTPQTAAAIGIVQFGPYPFSTEVIFTISNEQDANCKIISNRVILYFCPPENNNPCDAIIADVNLDNSCDLITAGSLFGATNSSFISQNCTETIARDVWFQFTALQEYHYISISNLSLEGGFVTTGFIVYEASDCNDLTEVVCSETIAGGLNDLTVGNTYYIRVYISAGISCCDFELCISSPPENDDPCGALLAEVNADDSCDITTEGALLAARASDISVGSCDGTPNDDVWFQFTALEEDQLIALSPLEGKPFSALDHGLYEGPDCNNLTEIYCTSASDGLARDLVIGNTYFIRVFSSNNRPEDSNSFFDLCIRPKAPSIITDQTTYTVEELVKDVLIASDCADVSNVTWSTGINFPDALGGSNPNGIAYFSLEDNADFPFEEGVLLSSGDASEAIGPNTRRTVGSGFFTWLGDDELNRVVDPTWNSSDLFYPTKNATIIEFDFVPSTNEFSFDFLMASEEYNTAFFECGFSDAFAFLLTDQNGVTTNLAVIPGSQTPITVTNIHPENSDCSAINEEYFDKYNDYAAGAIAFNGMTKEFKAQSAVTPGEVYHIKLVIADYGDTLLDAGVFLKGKSFIIDELDLGADITVENGSAVCVGQPVVLDTNTQDAEFVWFLDGFLIEDETNSTYTATEPGLYTAQVIFTNECIFEDEILVQFLDIVEANAPSDLDSCSSTGFSSFNLTDNDAEILGAQSPADVSVSYYLTEDAAEEGLDPLSSPYINISSPQTIYASVRNLETGCYTTTSFNLVNTIPDFTAQSVDILNCDNDGDGFSEFDLESNTVDVLDGQDISQFTVTYHTSADDANSNLEPLSSPYVSPGETIFVRVESIDGTNCFVVNSFDLVIGIEPETSFTTDFAYEVCPNALAPLIIEVTPGNYSISEVGIQWFRDGQPEPIVGENGFTLPVFEADTYSIEVTFNDTGCSSIQTQEVIELESCFIPQGISPNGDGLNDNFDLSNFRVIKLELYNRFGLLVYQKTNYVNEWVGQSDKGDELPVGTYFYSVSFQDKESETGWVYLQKEK